MNLLNRAPVFLLLLIFLSSLSFATYVVYKVNFDIATNTIYFNMHGESTSGSTISLFGISDSLGTHTMTSSTLTISNTTGTHYAYGGAWSYYCWASGVKIICDGSGTITSSTELSCNQANFVNYIPMSNFTPRYDIAGPTNCSNVYGSSWINVDDVRISSTGPGVSMSMVSGLGKSCQYCGYDAEDVCFYNTPNRVLTNPVGKYFFARDDATCIECTNGDSQCLNTTKDNQTCIDNLWVTTKTCQAGAYSDCGLNYSSQCPTPSVTIDEPSFAACTNSTNCSSYEVCSNGWTARNPLTCLVTSGTLYEDIAACGDTSGRYCMLADGEACTDRMQCASYSCKGMDATGVGTCTKVCSLNPTTDCGTAATCIKATEDSLINQTVDLVSYCVQSQKAFCAGNDQCGTGNCKPYCGGSIATDGHCLSPGYACSCVTSAECDAGETCTSAPAYTGGPICLSCNFLSPSGSASIFKYCAPGISEGLTCTSSSQCSSNNCQNGYCCGTGKVCCSNDAQCSGGQVCFNNAAWSSTTLYMTCGPKRGYLSPCFENKECVTQPCTPMSGMTMGLCGGVPIPTYATYTTDLPTGNSIGTTQIFNVTVSYKVASNGSVVQNAGCRIYVKGIYQSEVSCASPIPLLIPQTGPASVTIIATRFGHANATIGPFTVNVYNSGANNATYGYDCYLDAQCASGRCGEINTPANIIRCSSEADCNAGQELYLSLVGTCMGYMPERIFAGTYYPEVLGHCQGDYITRKCVANDTYDACNPLLPMQCYYTQGLLCNPATYTCSATVLGIGSECSTTSDCATGLLCNSDSDGSKEVCCAASSTSVKCCQADADCDTGSGYVCDSNPLIGTFSCIKPTGGTGTIGKPCSSDSECSVKDGMECGIWAGGVDLVREDGTPIPAGSSICKAKTCPAGLVVCKFCSGNKSLSTTECGNNTLSLTCSSNILECRQENNGEVITPADPTTGAGAASFNVEDMFKQIVTFMYYILLMLGVFMIIAFVIAGFTFALGLVRNR